MQILLRKASIKVYNPEKTVVVVDPITNTSATVTDTAEENSHIIFANPNIQVVPDWVVDDPTFKARVKDKTILILQTIAIEEGDSADTKLVKATAQAAAAGVPVAAAASGWNAKPDAGVGLPTQPVFPAK